MTESEAIKLGKDLYENITSNANNIIPTKEYIEFVGKSIEALEKVQEYRAIGTIERFRELTEKAEPKKPTIERVKFSNNQYADNYKCPTCGARMISKDETGWYSGRRSKYCEECGTAISWE